MRVLHYISRRRFATDLQSLADASAMDFQEALNIVKPTDTVGPSMSRSGMPGKGKTALRTLLLRTSDVPGTEEQKSALRLDRKSNNRRSSVALLAQVPACASSRQHLGRAAAREGTPPAALACLADASTL